MMDHCYSNAWDVISLLSIKKDIATHLGHDYCCFSVSSYYPYYELELYYNNSDKTKTHVYKIIWLANSVP